MTRGKMLSLAAGVTLGMGALLGRMLDEGGVSAQVRGPERAAAGSAVRFDASASSGDIRRFAWDFGDGLTAVAGPTVAHVYQAPGEYTVTLNVVDTDDASAEATWTVTVAQADAGSQGDY